MKYALLLVSLLLFSAQGFLDEPKPTICAACTIVVELIDQLIEIRKAPIDDFVMNQFCELFPSHVKTACSVVLVNVYGPAVIDGLLRGHNSDKICRSIQLCVEDNCRIRPTPMSNIGIAMENGLYEMSVPAHFNPDEEYHRELLQNTVLKAEETFGSLGLFDWIKDIIKRVVDKKPIYDIDDDYFSTLPYLRGSNWRGKDCNDWDAKVYPGRRVDPHPLFNVDYSCNGINGTHPASGRPWKEALCVKSRQMGVAVLGDSAGAKFSIPADYMNASRITNETFQGLYDVLLNEIDQPYFSAYTGFADGDSHNPRNSIYKKMRERNLCNHRDYQNLATNGARSGSIFKNSQTLMRDGSVDHPLLLFLELIGNDVCSSAQNTDWYTKPEEFRMNIMKLLSWLDTKLPKGSHVTIFGLVDGRVLWDRLWNRTHPIGQPYYRIYDYLNCLKVNPCWGWLNSNETVRNLTTEHAMRLNRVYREIVADTKGRYNNFDILYLDFPAAEIFDKFVREGGNPLELIEPIDGFHPGDMFNSLLADWLWDKILTLRPEWIGGVNPNNALIKEIFGDQGSH